MTQQTLQQRAPRAAVVCLFVSLALTGLIALLAGWAPWWKTYAFFFAVFLFASFAAWVNTTARHQERQAVIELNERDKARGQAADVSAAAAAADRTEPAATAPETIAPEDRARRWTE